LGTLIAAIEEQFLKKWKLPEQRAQDENAAIAILNVRVMNDGVKQQAYSVEKNMSLLAFDLLARVIAMGIDTAPSVSGLIFVRSRPGAIVERRLKDITRIRPARSVEEIEFHQNLAMSVCAEYAKHLKLDLHVVRAGDEGSFASVATSMLAIERQPLQTPKV
jgi:hypothetical protein